MSCSGTSRQLAVRLFLVGTLASLASGLLAIDWLLKVRRHTYDVFVWYRLVVAVIIALGILSGVRGASF